MGSLKLPHASGNSVSIAAPQSNPSSDRTLYVPGGGDATICTTVDRGFQAGEVVQVQFTEYVPSTSGSGPFTNGTYTNIGACGLTASFTPKFADSVITIETNFEAKLNDEDGYARWQWYDNTNSTIFHNGTYSGASHYYVATDDYVPVVLKAKGAAINTNARTYSLRLIIGLGGTIEFNWSGEDRRVLTITEIKQ